MDMVALCMEMMLILLTILDFLKMIKDMGSAHYSLRKKNLKRANGKTMKSKNLMNLIVKKRNS